MSAPAIAEVRDIKLDFEQSFNLPFSWLKLIGLKLLPRELEEEKKWFHYTSQDYLRYISYVLISTNIIFETTYLANVIGNFTNFIEVVYIIPSVCSYFLSFSKMLTISKSKSKLYDLVQELKTIWPHNFKSDEEIKTVEYFMKPAHFLTRYLAILYLSLFCVWSINPIAEVLYNYFVNGKFVKILPYLMLMPFDPYSTYGYPVAYTLEIITGLAPLTSLVCVDVLFVMINTHICIQMKFVQMRLQNIIETANEDTSLEVNQNRNTAAHALLIECADRYNLLIRLSKTLDEIYRPSFLLNFLLSSVIICCVGFLLLFASKVNAVKFVVYLSESLVHIFIICYSGQQLIDTSSEISEAAYNSAWYTADEKFRRSLQIIMMRAARPQQITALKFFVLSLLSFSRILYTSYSYYTLIRTMYERPAA